MSPYCITVCVPARLSAFHVTILHYSVCSSKAVCSSCHQMHYSVCASKAFCSSCHHTRLQCVCPQGCSQFMSPYCITVCVTARLSAVHVTILHYSVCASKAVCSLCHNTASQCVCQQGCLQFMSPFCIILCVPTRLPAVHVTILHYSVRAIKVLCSSCHHTSLQCVCQQGCMQFNSPYCITVCVPYTLMAYTLGAYSTSYTRNAQTTSQNSWQF